MVMVKMAAILIFVSRRGRAVEARTGGPFMPNGFGGVLTGAAIVFFTYIGFDSVSTAAEEARNPQRDLPFGIMASLIICTLLYVSVALVLTGIADWKTLNTPRPVVDALKALGWNRCGAGSAWAPSWA
jgi:APA family basic amino acid/polyamine antiporter